jgi:hypothetical protein
MEWSVSVTPRPLFTPGKDPVPIVQEVGWASGPVWAGAENLAPSGFDPRTVQAVASHCTDWATRPNFPVDIRNILAHGRLCFVCVQKMIEFTSDEFALQRCFEAGVWLPAFLANRSSLPRTAMNLKMNLAYVLCLKCRPWNVQEIAL